MGVASAALFFIYGQLTREDNAALDKTFIYSYNEIGNYEIQYLIDKEYQWLEDLSSLVKGGR